MAEETKDQNLQAQKTVSDDVIDLEGLVRDIDKGPGDGSDAKPTHSVENAARPTSNTAANDTPAVAAASAATKTPVAKHEPIHDEELSTESLDELLMQEDPELAAQMASIREVGIADSADGIAGGLEQDEAVVAALIGKSKLRLSERLQLQRLKFRARVGAIKRLVARAMKDSKGVLRELLIRAKVAAISYLRTRKAQLGHGFGWIKSRTGAQKGALFLVIVILSGMVYVSLKTIKGTLLPKTEKLWVANFADHADGTFKYDVNGPVEDFNDPLLHPEFVILIERVVVNLTRTPEAAEAANPMAAFELYLQTDNQEAAVEIKDRSVEIRDAIARSVERMTYPDLVGEEGKAKLKLLIRKDLNEIITKGKVRRVFFKTIVLNPE